MKKNKISDMEQKHRVFCGKTRMYACVNVFRAAHKKVGELGLANDLVVTMSGVAVRVWMSGEIAFTSCLSRKETARRLSLVGKILHLSNCCKTKAIDPYCIDYEIFISHVGSTVDVYRLCICNNKYMYVEGMTQFPYAQQFCEDYVVTVWADGLMTTGRSTLTCDDHFAMLWRVREDCAMASACGTKFPVLTDLEGHTVLW